MYYICIYTYRESGAGEGAQLLFDYSAACLVLLGVYIYIYRERETYICMCIYMYIYIFLCVCVYICIHIYYVYILYEECGAGDGAPRLFDYPAACAAGYMYE